MNLTVNFILLFLLIILPGIVFRRFYFYGEFSKQFRIKEPLIHLFISNIIPGILNVLLAIWLTHFILDGITFSGFLTNISLINEKNEINTQFVNELSAIIPITIAVSTLTGLSLSRLIRFFKLDIKHRLLRYRNTWYYVFSGEISDFKKFKTQLNVNFINKRKNDLHPPIVDILIQTGGETKLYTGALLDYELSHSDIIKLERVYLKNPKI